VRTAAVVTLLGVVLVASALDLALGLLWIAALVAVLVARRRVRVAPVLVLLATAALLGWGGRLGWFGPPAPASYEAGWIPRWGESRPMLPAPGAPEIVSARERLAALGRDELRLTGSELVQRAGAVIGLTRRLDPLRADAPREVGAIEAAARRLARTLAAPEFRDLEARRVAAAQYLGELERRLGAARDATEAISTLRGADPAAMAHVSLRPVREDLAAAGTAVEALVRVLGGGVPTVTTTTTAHYDESRREMRWEARYQVASAPAVRLLRVETRAFRNATPAGGAASLAYAPGGEGPRPVPAGAWLDLEPAPRGVTIVATWALPVTPRPVHAALRTLAFERLEMSALTRTDDAVFMAVLDGRPGVEMPLALRLLPPRLTRLAVPGHALHFVSRPGAVTSNSEGDVWEPGEGDSGPLEVQLVPKWLLLRNAAFAWARGYLYRPNLGALLAATGLAALTLVLVRRSRSVDVEKR
jgi:hypothetical protein